MARMEAGDVLSIPKGTYLTSPVTVDKSGLTLVLEEGSIIRFIDDPGRYEPVYTRWEGVRCYAMHPCFWITGCRNVTIKGKGVLDGNGSWWWSEADVKKRQAGPVSPIEKKFAALNPEYARQPGGGGGRQSQFLRPPLLQIHQCEDILLEGITLQNSPFWTLHPLFSKRVSIQQVTIINPKDAPNTDGVDIDSCQDVQVIGCNVTVGDDGIAMKSGIGEDALAVGIPTCGVIVKHCIVRCAHGGAVIGSETGSGIHDIHVSDCVFDGTDRGVRIKTRRGRAGDISGLSFRNIMMHDTLCPITINMYYVCGSKDATVFSLEKMPVTPITPGISDITIEHIKADGIRCMAAFIIGLPEKPVENLSITDCDFTMAKTGLRPVEESEMYQGLPSNPTRGLRLRNVHVHLAGITGQEPVLEQDVLLF